MVNESIGQIYQITILEHCSLLFKMEWNGITTKLSYTDNYINADANQNINLKGRMQTMVEGKMYKEGV